ncbi:nitroreductase family protein [Acetobacterium sp.]|uniref:nitroreductase family protein n=1 Tax=Acetobacterium sp. TaxID=1872094 RepID=UPI002F404A41
MVSHDAVIATDHMMLQATELGVQSVWVCWFDPGVIKTEFDLEENFEVINILVLGYSNEVKSNPDRHVKAHKLLSNLVVYK